jgi:hypothetical protein
MNGAPDCFGWLRTCNGEGEGRSLDFAQDDNFIGVGKWKRQRRGGLTVYIPTHVAVKLRHEWGTRLFWVVENL